MPNTDFFDSNNYRFNSKSKLGVLIIHGFTNTTFETKDLAKHLSNNGFHSLTKNLPGHGTTVEDCNRYKYTDWINFVERELAELASCCDKIFVIGISMGSVLAMYLCTMFPISAAVFGAPVLEFKDQFGTRILTPLLHKIVRTHKKGFSYPREIRNKMKFFGYQEWPMSAVNEFRKLTNVVKKELKQIKTPSLIIHSKQDKLQLPSNNLFVYNSISSLVKDNLILNNAGHNLYAKSPDQKIVFKKITKFLKDNC